MERQRIAPICAELRHNCAAYHRPGIVLATRERVSLDVVHSIGQLWREARAIT